MTDVTPVGPPDDSRPQPSPQRFGNRQLAVAVTRWGAFFSFIAIATGVGAYEFLGSGFKRTSIGPAEAFELIKVALTVAGGLGAVIALAVAFRRQALSEEEHVISSSERQVKQRAEYRDRYERAVKLMDESGSAAARIAGVSVLIALAKEWSEGRQVCIDFLCSYFRMSSHLDDLRRSNQEPVRDALVRRQLLHELARQTLMDPTLRDLNYDFSQSIFHGDSFTGMTLGNGSLNISHSIIRGDGLNLGGLSVDGGLVEARELVVESGLLRLDGLRASETALHFDDARLIQGGITLESAQLDRVQCSMRGLTLGSAAIVHVNETYISNAQEIHPLSVFDFAGAQLGGGRIWIRAIRTEGARTPDYPEGREELEPLLADFRNAHIENTVVHFEEVPKPEHSKRSPFRIANFSRAQLGKGAVVTFDYCWIGYSLEFLYLDLDSDSQLLFRDCIFGSRSGLARASEILNNMRTGKTGPGWSDYSEYDPLPHLDFGGAELRSGLIEVHGCKVRHGTLNLMSGELYDCVVRVEDCYEDRLAVNIDHLSFRGSGRLELGGWQSILLAVGEYQLQHPENVNLEVWNGERRGVRTDLAALKDGGRRIEVVVNNWTHH